MFIGSHIPSGRTAALGLALTQASKFPAGEVPQHPNAKNTEFRGPSEGPYPNDRSLKCFTKDADHKGG